MTGPRDATEAKTAGLRRLHVLWLTNIPLPAVRSRQGLAEIAGGGWLSAGLTALVDAAPGVTVTCAARSWPAPDPFEAGGVRYVTIPGDEPAGRWRGMFRAWTDGMRERAPVDAILRLVDQERPDVVHVHGTETANALGALLAGERTATPVLVSIQGPVSEYAPLFFSGSRRVDIASDVLTLEFLKGDGSVHAWRRMRRAAARELVTFGKMTDAAGRTEWDREIVRRANPNARYWHVGEVLRRPFYETTRTGSAEDVPVILAVTSAAPYKGIDVLLRAFARIRDRWPARLLVVGDISGSAIWRQLRRLQDRLGLAGLVEWVGGRGAEEVAEMLSTCDVFVCASRIENSPNSVCEAMLVGAPVVASRTGGIPSLITHDHDGLLFEPGDDAALCREVTRVLDDRDLARSLGDRARETALQRHAPATVAAQLAGVYATLAGGVRG